MGCRWQPISLTPIPYILTPIKLFALFDLLCYNYFQAKIMRKENKEYEQV